jgi:valyl-tRNA synthetase
MPFITEEIWQILKKQTSSYQWPESIMIANYPVGNETAIDNQAEVVIDTLIEIVHSIRNTRAEHKVESNKQIEAHVYAGSLVNSLKTYSQTIQSLAQVKPLELIGSRHQGSSDDKELVMVLKEVEVVIPLASMVDAEAEKARLQKEYLEIKTNVVRLEVRLQDTAFISKAPPAVVEKERTRLAEGKDKLARLEQQLTRYK